MTNTDGQIGDGRKRLEPEWMRARQPMYQPRERGPKAVAVHPDRCWRCSRSADHCVCARTVSLTQARVNWRIEQERASRLVDLRAGVG